MRYPLAPSGSGSTEDIGAGGGGGDCSVGAIGLGSQAHCQELGVTRNTVRRYLGAGGWVPYRQPQRAAALAGHEAWLRSQFLHHRGNCDVVRQQLLWELGIEASQSPRCPRSPVRGPRGNSGDGIRWVQKFIGSSGYPGLYVTHDPIWMRLGLTAWGCKCQRTQARAIYQAPQGGHAVAQIRGRWLPIQSRKGGSARSLRRTRPLVPDRCRCPQQVLKLHHFPAELGTRECLVRSAGSS